jgi:hypothetical protein
VAKLKNRFMRGKQPERDLKILGEMRDCPGLKTIYQAVDARVKNDAYL